MAKKREAPKPKNPELEVALLGVQQDPLFGTLAASARLLKVETDSRIPPGEWVAVTNYAEVLIAVRKRGSVKEWQHALAHALLHLAFGHVREHASLVHWNWACDAVVERFLAGVRFGTPPLEYRCDWPQGSADEETLYRDALIAGLPAGYRGDLVLEPRRWTAPTSPEQWAKTFAVALRHAVRAAVTKASGDDVATKTEADRAKDWFLMHFPLLGALAVGFTVVADIAVCRRLDVRIAAVDPSMKEVYVNPSAALDPDEMRFVLAHELLHVALRHHLRTEGRDAYLWNVACDYVINGWLAEMRVGVMPSGLLYDPELRGLSAEAVYDRICGDLRTYRKLATLRGTGLGDVLGERGPEWWTRGEGLDLDEFSGRCSRRGSSCISRPVAASCRPGSSRRSAPSRCRRSRGTSSWRSGSTGSSSCLRRRGGRTPGRRGGRRRRPTSPVRGP